MLQSVWPQHLNCYTACGHPPLSPDDPPRHDHRVLTGCHNSQGLNKGLPSYCTYYTLPLTIEVRSLKTMLECISIQVILPPIGGVRKVKKLSKKTKLLGFKCKKIKLKFKTRQPPFPFIMWKMVLLKNITNPAKILKNKHLVAKIAILGMGCKSWMWSHCCERIAIWLSF